MPPCAFLETSQLFSGDTPDTCITALRCGELDQSKTMRRTRLCLHRVFKLQRRDHLFQQLRGQLHTQKSSGGNYHTHRNNQWRWQVAFNCSCCWEIQESAVLDDYCWEHVFFARQGIALQGGGNGLADGNFCQLLHLKAVDQPHLLTWLERKSTKYTSPQIQNELLTVMACRVLCGISEAIQEDQ